MLKDIRDKYCFFFFFFPKQQKAYNYAAKFSTSVWCSFRIPTIFCRNHTSLPHLRVMKQRFIYLLFPRMPLREHLRKQVPLYKYNYLRVYWSAFCALVGHPCINADTSRYKDTKG